MNQAIPDAARIVIALLILLPAALQDWRERRASDRYWIAGGVAGFLLMEAELLAAAVPVFYHIFVVAIAWIYFDVFWSGEEIFGENGANLKGVNALRLSAYLLSVAVFVVGVYLFRGEMMFSMLLSVLGMILFIYLLYMFDVIKGGADAKALMFLSVLFPHYPAISSMAAALPIVPPMTAGSFSGVLTWEQVFLPFSFLVFMMGAMASLFVPLYMFSLNLVRGDTKMPQALFGYRMPLEDVEGGHVWLMDWIEDGKIKLSLFPKDDDTEQIGMLREMGMEMVWVNPKIPFLIPITAGFILALIAGNLLLLIV